MDCSQPPRYGRPLVPRLTKKVMNKPSKRRCLFATRKKLSTGLEDNGFDNDISPAETAGAYLSQRVQALLDEVQWFLTRNDYEYDLGHFRYGAIRRTSPNFREVATMDP